MEKKMRVAQIQMWVTNDKKENLKIAFDWCLRLKKEKIDIISLPEMFNCPYDTAQFPKYAETEKAETWQFLSKLAMENNWYVIGGSIPEISEGRYYNTSYTFNRKGEQIGKHRKMHLFDIDVVGGQRFRESDILSAGSESTVIDTEFGKIGIAICYDIRFPELMRLMVLDGAEFIFIPGAFNMTTGPAHWEILFRTRAMDNQVYMFGTAPSRDMTANYHSYGHSIVTTPWGDVLDQLGFEEDVLINTIDTNKIKEVRDQLPLLKHRRQDLYICEKT
jgi:omega-amidase